MASLTAQRGFSRLRASTPSGEVRVYLIFYGQFSFFFASGNLANVLRYFPTQALNFAFKDAIKAVLEAPYAAATSALKLQNTPGALASLGRLMDVRRGVDVVVATAPFLKDAEGAAAFAETLAGGGKSTPLALYKLVYVEKVDGLGVHRPLCKKAEQGEGSAYSEH